MTASSEAAGRPWCRSQAPAALVRARRSAARRAPRRPRPARARRAARATDQPRVVRTWRSASRRRPWAAMATAIWPSMRARPRGSPENSGLRSSTWVSAASQSGHWSRKCDCTIQRIRSSGSGSTGDRLVAGGAQHPVVVLGVPAGDVLVERADVVPERVGPHHGACPCRPPCGGTAAGRRSAGRRRCRGGGSRCRRRGPRGRWWSSRRRSPPAGASWRRALAGSHRSSSSQKPRIGRRAAAAPQLRLPGRPLPRSLKRMRTGRCGSSLASSHSGSFLSHTTRVSMGPGWSWATTAAIASRTCTGRA